MFSVRKFIPTSCVGSWSPAQQMSYCSQRLLFGSPGIRDFNELRGFFSSAMVFFDRSSLTRERNVTIAMFSSCYGFSSTVFFSAMSSFFRCHCLAQVSIFIRVAFPDFEREMEMREYRGMCTKSTNKSVLNADQDTPVMIAVLSTGHSLPSCVSCSLPSVLSAISICLTSHFNGRIWK